jgi:hypothetical protein
MMFVYGTGEKYHFLIALPQSIRHVKAKNVAIKALHLWQAFYIQPEMRKGRLERQGWIHV